MKQDHLVIREALKDIDTVKGSELNDSRVELTHKTILNSILSEVERKIERAIFNEGMAKEVAKGLSKSASQKMKQDLKIARDKDVL